jgi:guanylate kinase
MKTAVKEVAARDEFDYEIINGDPERARREIIDLMTKIAEGGDDAE